MGTKPVFLAGRDGEVKRYRSILRGAPEIPANVRLTGLRGVGKTVLLSEFQEIADSENWATINIELEARHNRDEEVTARVGSACRDLENQLSVRAKLRDTAGKAVGAFRNIKFVYEDVTLQFDGFGSDSTNDLAKVLTSALAVADRTGHAGVALLLDEAQMLHDEKTRDGEHPLSMLLAAVSALQKKQYPVSLVLCGLPTLTTHLLEARTYSERMFRGEEIGSLDSQEASDAFLEPLTDTGITASTALVDAVLDSVEGYPYFVQLWGAELWDAADYIDASEFTLQLLMDVEPEIYSRLDRDFYEPRITTLTPAEQDLLIATAKCSYPPLVTVDINASLEKRPGNINVLLGRLVNAGVMYRPRKGVYEYTAPKFYDFLKRRVAAERH
ncbi:MAG: ATP-binding protein [Acidimicrobiia bacterium]